MADGNSACYLSAASSKQRGFTLIEVVIAVVILSTAFITLLGLQSSIMKRTLRDEEKQQAMLLARSILAAIESNVDEIQPQDETLPAGEMIEKLLTDAAPRSEEGEDVQRFNLLARLAVDVWGIPNLKDDAMKRIRLSIFSAEAPEEAFEVLFFIPNEDSSELIE
ncbi:MAG: prepilin-type N-terminal cleavage/methylation domain-containing protein [Deltaproteobacteria bacterium]|nr:prepilin-type N-terminal cleavage/methylation domain-containing protein [Deltaproteobacteria bacterium]